MFDSKLALRDKEVSALLGCSSRALWSWVTAGKFPKPFELGRLRRWRREDVETWLKRKALEAQAEGVAS